MPAPRRPDAGLRPGSRADNGAKAMGEISTAGRDIASVPWICRRRTAGQRVERSRSSAKSLIRKNPRPARPRPADLAQSFPDLRVAMAIRITSVGDGVLKVDGQLSGEEA